KHVRANCPHSILPAVVRVGAFVPSLFLPDTTWSSLFSVPAPAPPCPLSLHDALPICSCLTVAVMFPPPNGYRYTSYIGSAAPLCHAPGALATVRPTAETVPSARFKLLTSPKVRYPPLPSSRLYKFQKSVALWPVAANPAFALLVPTPKSMSSNRSEERRVGKASRYRT